MHFGTTFLLCWSVLITGTISQKMDLIFLLDGSYSVGEANFEIVKNLVKDFAENVDLSGPVNLGVVQYSTLIPIFDVSDQPFMKTEIKLGQHTNKKAFQAAVDKIVLQGYETYTALAMNKVVLDFKSSERFADDETSKTIILITDGRATDRLYLAGSSAYARMNHIKIYAIGVGAADEGELQIIANGQPGNSERVYHASDYSDLQSTVFKRVTAEIYPENCIEGTVSKKIDLMFVLDGSGSVKQAEFEIMKNEIKVFAENTDLSGPVKLGILQYSFTANTEIKLGQYTNVGEFKAAVDKIRQRQGTTATTSAIQKTVLDFKSSERFSDDATSKIMILITDGQANNRRTVSASAAEARRNNIKIYAVGVGHANMEELQIIANGNPGNNERVYLMKDFSTLRTGLKEIEKSVCRSAI